VADISVAFLGDASSAVCVLYSLLRLGERPGNAAEVWKSVESIEGSPNRTITGLGEKIHSKKNSTTATTKRNNL